MAVMTISEARAALPEVLNRVAEGEEITITRHGRPVAVVVRPDIVWHQSGTDVVLGQTGGLVAALRQRARRNGRSLQQEVDLLLAEEDDSTATLPPYSAENGPDDRQLAMVPRGKSTMMRVADLDVRPDRVMLDTNVLLAATDEGRAEHRDALMIMNEWAAGGTTLCTSGQILREYLAVATRPVDTTASA